MWKKRKSTLLKKKECNNPLPEISSGHTQCQSRQRELIRVLAHWAILLIQLIYLYIFATSHMSPLEQKEKKRKEKEKEKWILT